MYGQSSDSLVAITSPVLTYMKLNGIDTFVEEPPLNWQTKKVIPMRHIQNSKASFPCLFSQYQSNLKQNICPVCSEQMTKYEVDPIMMQFIVRIQPINLPYNALYKQNGTLYFTECSPTQQIKRAYKQKDQMNLRVQDVNKSPMIQQIMKQLGLPSDVLIPLDYANVQQVQSQFVKFELPPKMDSFQACLLLNNDLVYDRICFMIQDYQIIMPLSFQFPFNTRIAFDEDNKIIYFCYEYNEVLFCYTGQVKSQKEIFIVKDTAYFQIQTKLRIFYLSYFRGKLLVVIPDGNCFKLDPSTKKYTTFKISSTSENYGIIIKNSNFLIVGISQYKKLIFTECDNKSYQSPMTIQDKKYNLIIQKDEKNYLILSTTELLTSPEISVPIMNLDTNHQLVTFQNNLQLATAQFVPYINYSSFSSILIQTSSNRVSRLKIANNQILNEDV